MRAHGTHACYVWGPESGCVPGRGCRCDDCKRAAADYERERLRRVAPPYVDAEPARRHIRRLQAAGIGTKTISKRSGVSTGIISKLLHGTPLPGGGRRPPSKRIRVETRDKILAVLPADAADRGSIDATRTLENVDTLLARGWTKAAIARAITGNPDAVGLQIARGGKVHARTARAVEALLDQPVPPRRSRHGEHPVEQPEKVAEPAAVDLPRPRPLDRDELKWRRRSACQFPNVPLWLFFPSATDDETIAAAKAVCATCPVSTQCLDANLDEPHGVYGGLTEKERREVRRQRRDQGDRKEAA